MQESRNSELIFSNQIQNRSSIPAFLIGILPPVADLNSSRLFLNLTLMPFGGGNFEPQKARNDTKGVEGAERGETRALRREL